jgi:hypothetical protein
VRTDAPMANDRLLLTTRPANDGYGRCYIAVELTSPAAIIYDLLPSGGKHATGRMELYVCRYVCMYGDGMSRRALTGRVHTAMMMGEDKNNNILVVARAKRA